MTAAVLGCRQTDVRPRYDVSVGRQRWRPRLQALRAVAARTRRLFTAGADISDMPPEPAGFFRMVRAIDATPDSPIASDDPRRKVATLFPPMHLFYPDMRVLPLLYDELVLWLNRREVGNAMDGYTRATVALAGNKYDDDTRAAALDLVADDERTYLRASGAADAGTATPIKARVLDARLCSLVR